MLFSLVVAVFFLPYHFLIQVDRSEESCNVIENFRGLLDTVARKENETLAKFVGELRKSERRLEEAFDTLNDEIQSSLSHSHRKHRHEIISAERNITTMKRETVLNIFDRATFDNNLKRRLDAYTTDAEKISYLTEELADETEGNIRLQNIIGGINSEKNRADAPYQLLQFRRFLENKIDEVYGPEGKPAQRGYMDTLEDALTGVGNKFTTNPRIMAFREMIGDKMAITVYLEAAKALYKELSNRAAHDLLGYVIRVPRYDEYEKIKKILELGGIEALPSYVSVISMALNPVDPPPMSSGNKDRRCLLISPLRARDWALFKPTGEHGGISQKDVLHMFPEPTGKPFKAVWVSDTKYHIQAEFESEEAAQNAKYNNLVYLKASIKVEFDVIGCYVESIPSRGIVIEEMFQPKEPEEITKASDGNQEDRADDRQG